MRRTVFLGLVILSACGRAEVGFPEGRHMSERTQSVRHEGGPSRAEDRHLPLLLVTADVIELGSEEAAGLSSLLQYHDPQVEIRTSLPWAANGLVFVAVNRSELSTVSRRIERLEAVDRRRTSATIREGADGSLDILTKGSGTRIVALRTGPGEEGAVRRETVSIEGTAVRVRALRVTPGTFEVELIPLTRAWVSEGLEVLEWPELAAHLVVTEGQSVLLMAGGEDRESAGRALLMRPEGSNEIQALVWLGFDRPD